MILSEIQADVYASLGYQSSPAADVVTRILRHINQGMRVVLGEPGLTRLVDSDVPYTFTSAASQARYAIPEAASRILHVTERTNDRSLGVMSLAEYRQIQPDPSSVSGLPSHVVPIGRVATAIPPSNASELFVVSTAAGDTNIAYADVVLTSGQRRQLSVPMTGVTAVSFSVGLATAISVEDFYLSANAAGTVTMVEDSGAGTVLGTITIGQKRPRYFGFYLWPTPQGAIDYTVDYRRELTELVNATDEPPIPTDYHYLLTTYARMREYEIKDDSRRETAREDWALGLSRLKYSLSLPEEIPVSGSRRKPVGLSRLGGWFPADTWRR